jgi:tetratricopeptide (TPR) repeat protein
MKIINMIILLLLSITLACGGTARKQPPAAKQQRSDPFSAYRAYDHFVRGDLYEQARNFTAAIEEYRKALIYDPGSAEIRRSLSEIYGRQRRFTEAAVLRSEIEEKEARDYNFIGDCLRYDNDLEGAADFYRRSLEIDSTQYNTRIYLAGMLYHLGDYHGAEENFKMASEFSTKKVEGYLELAAFYLRISENDKALETYYKALEEDPGEIRSALGAAGLHQSRGDTVTADSIYSSLMERHRDSIQSLNSLITTFYAIDRLDLAEKAAQRTAELLPNDPEMQRRYAFTLFGNGNFTVAESMMVALDDKGMADGLIYYYLGRLSQRRDDFSTAEGYFKESLAMDDTITYSWINLAVVTDAQGRYEEALDIMHEAYDKIPYDSLEVLYFTAIIHSRNEHFELARDGYLRLLESRPGDIDIGFNLAASYERLGQFDDAEREFQWIIESAPDHALALNYLGYMYADNGIKLDQALQMIEKAVSLDPQNGAFLDSYAWVLFRLGRHDEALVQMKEALKYDDGDAILYDHQGDIYSALTSHELARESWIKALEIDPDNEEIKAKLKPR